MHTNKPKNNNKAVDFKKFLNKIIIKRYSLFEVLYSNIIIIIFISYAYAKNLVEQMPKNKVNY